MERIITVSREIQSGIPVFTGTCVPVQNLFDYLKGGDTIDKCLNDFPSVKKHQVLSLLNVLEHKLPNELLQKDEEYFA